MKKSLTASALRKMLMSEPSEVPELGTRTKTNSPLHTTTRLNLADLMLSQRNPIFTNTCCTIPFIKMSKTHNTRLYYYQDKFK